MKKVTAVALLAIGGCLVAAGAGQSWGLGGALLGGGIYCGIMGMIYLD